MNVVRKSLKTNFFITASLVLLSSCNPTTIKGKIAKSGVVSNDGTFDGKAYVYRDSPYIIAGPRFSPDSPDMSTIIDKRRPELITTNTQLTSNCTMDFFSGSTQTEITECVRSITSTENLQSLPRKEDRTWIFPPGSPEFYQVNALYHLNQGIESFFKKLSFAFDHVNSLPQTLPRSIPPYLMNSEMFWLKGVSNIDSKFFRNGYINIQAQCDLQNASWSPAGPEICMGYFAAFKDFWLVQDPSVIQHEFGHAAVSIMMNLRNGTGSSAHALRSNLGSFRFDESGSINEGIADYFSYMINRRTHIGEWALGKGSAQSRPMTEADPMHIEGIDVTSEGRLSYPQFLFYDPNSPTMPLEDIHYAGQIAGHYLVALTEEFKNKCGISTIPTSVEAHDGATAYVVLLLAETLSEIGDLNAKGIDDYFWGAPLLSTHNFNNLDPANSYLWTQSINQPTFRKVFQVFAKNINRYISGTALTGPGLCPAFTKNDSEKLLDDYGLLLFKTYNDNGNSSKNRSVTFSSVAGIAPQPLTQVTENNRRKSVLASKELIQLAKRTVAEPNTIGTYIVDGRSDMDGHLKALLFKGLAVPLSTNVASIDYNNQNGRISPGEVVAVIPHLYNASNSTMAGVQLLATDWDHVDITDDTTGNFKPCAIDTFTTVDEGAEAGRTCSTNYPDKDYKRLVRDPGTGKFPLDAAAPVCMVLLEEGTSTRWVSQSEFRKKQGLTLVDKDCLGYKTSGTTDTDFTFNPHECLARFLPGGTEAFFSVIYSQKNFHDSVIKDSPEKTFGAGNILLMEVNKWIPPGTKFRCRLRARFTNCTDCYHDTAQSNDDYLDSDYNGHKPYKIINLDFDVND